MISNGSFPAKGSRSNLSSGERRQLRDANILSSHIRAGYDIFVTDDAKGFIDNKKREKIEKKFNTRIMLSKEFLEFCRMGKGEKP